MERIELSLVVPVFDEQQALPRLLAELGAAARALERPFELVCVDDGSRDESPLLLARAAARDEHVRVVTLPRNRGKGAAVRAGVLAARGELVVFMDCDLSTRLDALPRAIAALEDGCDVALGNRHAGAARLARRQPPLREALGESFRRLARTCFAPEIDDFTCGFKAFRADAARALFERARIDGWAFDVELVVLARRLGLRIAQLAVTWEHRDGSKVRVVRAALRALLDLTLLALRPSEIAGRAARPAGSAPAQDIDALPAPLPARTRDAHVPR